MTTNNPINPKISKTEFEVIKPGVNNTTWIKLNLLTGRTHQIRVHMASIGYPIVGDKVYGDLKFNNLFKDKFGLDRQALHASNIEFKMGGEVFKTTAEFKEDMKNIFNLI